MSALLLGLLAPLGYAALHGAAMRLSFTRRWPAQKSAVLSCALGAVLETASWWRTSPLFGILVSAATAHVYFHFFNMSETARRIRLLVCRYRGLEAGSGQTVIRLDRLEKLGEIERMGDEYVSRGGVLTFAAKIMVAYEACLFPERFTLRE